MNKNTKRMRSLALKNASRGNKMTEYETLVHQTPVKRRIEIASMGKDGVVSQNKVRNMQMRILHNRGENNTGNASATVHEPIDKRGVFTPKKRRDIKRDIPSVPAVSVGGENES